jgi:hypothetical protein
VNWQTRRGYAVVLLSVLLAACSGGGGSSSNVVAPTLVSIALSPLAVSLSPGQSQQLSVTGTYSDGSKQTIADTDQSYLSSAGAVATVSASGLVSVPSGATVGKTATISATNISTGITTSAAASSVVTVSSGGTGPTPNSVAAAQATAGNNALCTAITPFYWEIGDKTGAQVTGSLGVNSTGNPILASTRLTIASASKWIYGTYITQLRGSAANLTAQDITFLTMTSGYTNMGTDLSTATCPNTNGVPDTVNTCLTLTNAQGVSFSAQTPANIGIFYYDSGHMENHASQHGGLGDILNPDLGPTIGGLLDPSVNIVYTQPLMAGGIFTNASDYAVILRDILAGTLFMHDALGTNPVCTNKSPTCNAGFSPIPENWHYSIGHWVEDDPATNGDGAFSSPGAFGFDPWIDHTKTYYGLISREDTTGIQSGYQSAKCVRLIRQAWVTGVEQSGTIPQ